MWEQRRSTTDADLNRPVATVSDPERSKLVKLRIVLSLCAVAIAASTPAVQTHAAVHVGTETPPLVLHLSHQGRLLDSPGAQFKPPTGARGVKVRFPWLPGSGDLRTRGLVPFSQVLVAFTRNGVLLGKPELSRSGVDGFEITFTFDPFSITVKLSFQGSSSAALNTPDGADSVSVFLYGGASYREFNWTQTSGPLGQSIAIADLNADGIAIGDPGVNGN